jgi:hypothetical protein
MSDKKETTSRLDFFKKMALFGTGAIAGAAVIYSGSKYEAAKDSKKKIQLLTADNKLSRSQVGYGGRFI